MAVITSDELMQIVTDLIGDRTDDDALTILENAKDTIEDFSKTDGEDWKAKYEDNDRAWRERYKERFMSGNEESENENIEENVEEEKETTDTLDDLFEKGEE